MNRDEVSYQLPHTYDYLLTVCHSDTWQTVVLSKTASVAEMSTNYFIKVVICIQMTAANHSHQ